MSEITGSTTTNRDSTPASTAKARKVYSSPTSVQKDKKKRRRDRGDKPQFVPVNGSSVRPTTAQDGAQGEFGAMLPSGPRFDTEGVGITSGISGSSGRTSTNIFSQIGNAFSNIGGVPGVGGKRPVLNQQQIQNINTPFSSGRTARFDQEGIPAAEGFNNKVVGNYTIPTGPESGRYRGNVDRPFYNELGALLDRARTNIGGLSEAELRKLASYGLVEPNAMPSLIGGASASSSSGGGGGRGGGRGRGGGGGGGGGYTTPQQRTYQNSVVAQILNWRVATG